MTVIQKVNNQIVKAFEKLYEQVFIVGKLTRDRIEGLILSWVNVFPMLESNHLQVSSYGVNVGMNPSLDVELIGDPLMINEHTLPGIIASLGNNRPAITVFRAIQKAILWHRKMSIHSPYDKIYVKLLISIQPEVKVYLGTLVLT